MLQYLDVRMKGQISRTLPNNFFSKLSFWQIPKGSSMLNATLLGKCFQHVHVVSTIKCGTRCPNKQCLGVRLHTPWIMKHWDGVYLNQGPFHSAKRWAEIISVYQGRELNCVFAISVSGTRESKKMGWQMIILRWLFCFDSKIYQKGKTNVFICPFIHSTHII